MSGCVQGEFARTEKGWEGGAGSYLSDAEQRGPPGFPLFSIPTLPAATSLQISTPSIFQAHNEKWDSKNLISSHLRCHIPTLISCLISYNTPHKSNFFSPREMHKGRKTSPNSLSHTFGKFSSSITAWEEWKWCFNLNWKRGIKCILCGDLTAVVRHHRHQAFAGWYLRWKELISRQIQVQTSPENLLTLIFKHGSLLLSFQS